MAAKLKHNFTKFKAHLAVVAARKKAIRTGLQKDKDAYRKAFSTWVEVMAATKDT